MTNALTQMAKHLRGRIAQAGIKARVRVAPGGGFVQVFTVTFDAVFSEDDQRTIRSIAKVNHLTLVRGMEIIVEQMTNPQSMHFYLPAKRYEVVDADGKFLDGVSSLSAAHVAGKHGNRAPSAGGFAIIEIGA